MGKNTVTVNPLPTSLDPPHGDGRRRNEVMSQVMFTSSALPHHSNCLYVPNAAAEETVSLTSNVLLKLFLYQFRIYATTTFLYQFRIYANSTCVHALISMEIFQYMRCCKSPTRMTWTQYSLAFLICTMCACA